MGKENLFSEFPSVTTEEWEALILKDLKGADYNKKLVWHPIEGFDVRPYYRAENLQDKEYLSQLPNEFPYLRGIHTSGNPWQIVQEVNEKNPAKANIIAVESLTKGATSIVFNAQEVVGYADITTLLANINLEKTGVRFNHASNYLNIVKWFVKYIDEKGFDKAEIEGNISFDPIFYSLKKGKFYHSCEQDMAQAIELLHLTADMPNFKVININGLALHNSGATQVMELGYALAIANEYMAFLTDQGISSEEAAAHITMTLSIGSNYFMEIAKLRAARLLWSTLVEQYKPANEQAYKLRIQSVASSWNKTIFDPYVNMLRSTTEGMAAAIGGADAIALKPFDTAYKADDDFSRRISRNVQVILKEESFFDKVADPSAGSYYIENLTNSMAEHAWNLFKEVEKGGGAIQAIQNGSIKTAIETSCQQRDMEIATRRYVLLGTNQYPNLGEMMLDKIEKEEDTIEETDLKTYRGAYAFEALRLETEKYVVKNGRPKVFLLKIGNLSMRQARAGFITNFFGCVGYEIIESQGYATVTEGVKAALDEKAVIIAICSSDEEYATLGVECAQELRKANGKSKVIIAGNPTETIDALKAAGVTDFIHAKVNVLETLKKYNDQLL
ncbi:MAG: methylmalonyl-CoA mutase family protein [Bacteroidales bacterium]|jgi:methylmalonyl-CoA mutase|nr:methylmalonyl-CoA mutase family protein [Bacteroidales bacterium]